MRDKTIRLIAVLCYVCGAVFLGYTAFVSTYDALSGRGIALLCTLVVLSFLLATIMRCRIERTNVQKRRLIRLLLFLCFFLYGVILCNQLFLRPVADIFMMENSFVPTRTLWRYYTAYQSDPAQLSALLAFAAGHAALFAPLGFFLPCLFRSMEKAGWFFGLTIAILVCFEALLFFTNVRALNIDRVLLGLLGASLFYLVSKTQCLRSLMHRCHLKRRRRR